jgi:hypothetical protein
MMVLESGNLDLVRYCLNRGEKCDLETAKQLVATLPNKQKIIDLLTPCLIASFFRGLFGKKIK